MSGRLAVLFLTMMVSTAGTAVVGGRIAAPAAIDPARAEELWVADTAGVHRVSLADGASTLALPEAGGARAVAIDAGRTTAWAWTGRTLLALGFDGTRRLSLPLGLPETVHADLAVRPEDGSVWLAAGHELRSLSAAGAPLASWRLPETAVALALDPAADLLWVATAKGVAARDAVSGATIRSLDLGRNPDVRGISLTSAGSLWVALRDEARHVTADGTLLRTVAARGLVGLATAPDGGAWLADARTLRRIDAAGSTLFAIQPFDGQGTIDALAAHPTDGSVWVGGGFSLAKIDAAGQVLLREELPAGAHIRDLALFADGVPPLLEILAPREGALLDHRSPDIEVAWSDAGTGVAPASLELRLDGAPLGALCESRSDGASCAPASPLSEGSHTLTGSVRDLAGNEALPAEVHFTIDTVPPTINLVRPAHDAVVEEPELTFEGTVSEPAVLTLGGAEIPVGAGGGFVHGPVLLQEGDNTFAFAATDRAGNPGSLTVSVTWEPPAGPGLPPDPATVAPPLDRTVATDLYTAVEFLWTGRRPVQTGVVPGAIDPLRVSVLRGRVLTRGGEALDGAQVSVLGHPELGATSSRTDGSFDLAINGGGVRTVQIEKEGYLTVHRQTQVPWRTWAVLDEVALVPLDPETTVLTSGAADLQIARGSRVEDQDGVRRSTLLVPAGTQARLLLADGTAQPLPSLTFRATEYTVGPSGLQALPAPLPPTSAYTYAVELSVDEAIAANAREVKFDRPLSHYVENFLGFPVGTPVPSGFYDRQLAAWIPSEDGRVVKILGLTAGLADLDIDGTGAPADPSALAALAVTEDERRALAALYAPGQSLWRVPITHFTPWDFNWPFEPPEDAEPPEPDQEPETEEPEEEACEQPGSIIECQNQVLGEELPVTGTPFALVYRSDRVPGRRTAHRLRVPLSGDRVPASLKQIELKISIAGRSFAARYPAAPEQVHEFTWDGHDAYGRLLQGRQPVQVEIGYTYDGVYSRPQAGTRSFGQPGSSFGTSVSEARSEITFWRTYESALGQWSAQPLGFGGWTLSAQHAYDPRGVLQRGDGGRILGAGPLDQILTTVAGSPTASGYGPDGPASASLLYYPESVAVDPQGNVYVGERTRIRRIDRATGRITTIAGKTYGDYWGDGGPALQAELNYPRGLVLDAAGNLYFADAYNQRVRRIDTAGRITTVAGTGQPGYNGDGMPAVSARLYQPMDLALDSQGNLYIADYGNHRVRRVSPDGWIETVGSGLYPSGDFPGLELRIENPSGLAVAPDGSLYVALHNRHAVFRIDPSGTAWRVAGNGGVDFSGFTRDGVPATQTYVPYPGDIALDSVGNLYITSYGRVRKVGPTGLITTVAGGGRDLGDGIFAAAAWPAAEGLAFDGQGTLYIASWHRVRKVAPSLPSLSPAEIPIASPDGAEVWVFDGRGRHLRTLDSLTGSLRLRFHYDTAGRLAEVEDADGLRTSIERDAAGQARALVAPFGQRTDLTYANGSLESIRNPAGETVRLTSTSEGLLTGLTDPRNGEHTFAYDDLGRLRRDADPAGGFKAVTRTPQDDAYRIDLTTAEGTTTSYTVEELPTDERRWSNTSPAGLTSETLFRKDGSRRLTFPDGTVVTEAPGPDPRFGLQAPVTQSLQVRTPAGLTWTLSSEKTATWAAGNNPLLPDTLQKTVRINGRAYTSTWNANQRRSTLTTPAGRRRILDLDAKGRPVALQIGNLAPVAFTWDPAGRLTEVAQGTGADRRLLAFGYDAEGWLESLTDPLSRSLLFDRDPAGRVLRQTLPDQREIAFSYDPGGNMTSLTPPGRPEHTFDYTAVDLQEAYRPPDLGIGRVDTAYHYDRDRRLTRLERPDGKTVTLGHDGAGRLTTLDFSRGRITYTYDAAGRLATLSAPGGQSLTYTYDGRLLTRTTWTGPVSGSVERTYDNDFRIISEKVNGGTPIIYQYDADGLLVKAGDLTITRDPHTGLVTGTTLGVVTTANAYNAFGELIRQEAKVQDTPIFTADYTRDRLGRITRKVEVIEGVPDTWDYTYDPAGRLQEVHRNGLFLSRYGYDANGNRLRHISPLGIVAATYDDQDRLLTYGDTTYTYTANGELAAKTQGGATTLYEYDELGNLVKVMLPDGVEIEYVIDGQGRRVGKRVDGVLVAGWLYRDQLEPVIESGAATTHHLVYGSLPFSPDYYVEPGGHAFRIVNDHQGNPRFRIESESGKIIDRLTWDEFGGSPALGSGWGYLGFAGGTSDQHTGLTRFGFRDLQPEPGRWTRKDPILFSGKSLNLYSYSGNNPIDFIDPFGLACVNMSASPVAVKPEKGNAIWIAPQERYDGPIDGVRPPAWEGDWLKVWRGTHVAIMPDGIPRSYGPTSFTPIFPDIPGVTDSLPGRKLPDWPERHVDWAPPQFCPCPP